MSDPIVHFKGAPMMQDVQPNVAGWFAQFFNKEVATEDRLRALVRLHYPLKAFGLTGDVLQKLDSVDTTDPRLNLLQLIHRYAALKKDQGRNENAWAQLADRFLLADAADDEMSFYHAFYALACVGHAGRKRRDLFPSLREQAADLLIHVDEAHRESSRGLLARETACGYLFVHDQEAALRHWQIATVACRQAYEALLGRPIDDLERCAMARLLIVQRVRFPKLFAQEPIESCNVPENVFATLTATYARLAL
ncbi:MAG TPA: hypothetical protein VHA78_02095 [Candidatus Peribacteraceae bacterium]|nr:hypothetical protein [Candidatus Peribacteraceae bacterium]